MPHKELSPDALSGVIQSFVLREGTDYGEQEVAFETKVSRYGASSSVAKPRSSSIQNTESIDIVVRSTAGR